VGAITTYAVRRWGGGIALDQRAPDRRVVVEHRPAHLVERARAELLAKQAVVRAHGVFRQRTTLRDRRGRAAANHAVEDVDHRGRETAGRSEREDASSQPVITAHDDHGAERGDVASTQRFDQPDRRGRSVLVDLARILDKDHHRLRSTRIQRPPSQQRRDVRAAARVDDHRVEGVRPDRRECRREPHRHDPADLSIELRTQLVVASDDADRARSILFEVLSHTHPPRNAVPTPRDSRPEIVVSLFSFSHSLRTIGVASDFNPGGCLCSGRAGGSASRASTCAAPT